MKILKRYDRLLSIKKNLDGSCIIQRKSPFDSIKKHDILVVTNKFIGTGKWIIRELISMDTTRKDLIGNSQRINRRIREKRDNNNIHKDMAGIITSSSFIN